VETPGRFYVPLVQKATIGACFVKELHIFTPFLLLRWHEAIFNEARFFVELFQSLAHFVRESERSKGIACKSTKMF
jgi:hypothetical protein